MSTKTPFLMIGLLLITSATQAGITSWGDDFENPAYTPGTSWNGGGVWTITDGTVDLIGDGTSWNYFPAYGNYVDLDGSNLNAGVMQKTLDLAPGRYRFDFDLAGNQRPSYDPDDGVTVKVEVGLASEFYQVAWDAGFQTHSLYFDAVGSDPVSITLSFANDGGNGGALGDNVGALLDNVKVEAIPAPGAALLVVIGLSLVGWVKKRFA